VYNNVQKYNYPNLKLSKLLDNHSMI